MELSVYYDTEYDIAYFRFGDEPVHHSKIISDVIWADLDVAGNVVGVQIFDAKTDSAFSPLFSNFPKKEDVEKVLEYA